MHPIERLRYVARASGVPQPILVREAAGALLSFAHDPQGLVTACRRMISRQPTSGPLLWMASRVLTAADHVEELRTCIDELDADRTSLELRHALPVDNTVAVLGWPDAISAALAARGDTDVLVIDVLGEGSGLVQVLWDADVEAADVPLGGLGAAAAKADLVLLECSAMGPDSSLCVAGSLAAASVAQHRGTPVWLVGGVGRLLPGSLWDSLRDRVAMAEPWDADEEFVPLDLVSHVVGTAGVSSVSNALQQATCPIAAELLTSLR